MPSRRFATLTDSRMRMRVEERSASLVTHGHCLHASSALLRAPRCRPCTPSGGLPSDGCLPGGLVHRGSPLIVRGAAAKPGGARSALSGLPGRSTRPRSGRIQTKPPGRASPTERPESMTVTTICFPSGLHATTGALMPTHKHLPHLTQSVQAGSVRLHRHQRPRGPSGLGPDDTRLEERDRAPIRGPAGRPTVVSSRVVAQKPHRPTVDRHQIETVKAAEEAQRCAIRRPPRQADKGAMGGHEHRRAGVPRSATRRHCARRPSWAQQHACRREKAAQTCSSSHDTVPGIE